jgi:NAD(P)-dependent dehydrogenase (short-subunit alcohol dehydrogenase family)
VVIGSVAAMKALAHTGRYVAAKHGVVGLMRAFAVELGQHKIRVNSVHPTQVNTRSCSSPLTNLVMSRAFRFP